MNASTAFLLNLLLAMTWSAAVGRFSSTSLAVGFVVSYAVLAFTQPVMGASTYFAKARQLVALLVFVVWELVLASARVAHDVLTPAHRSRPGVVAIPLDARTDVEITVLANLISLTPGTLSLEVSEDRRVLYIHAMFVDDRDELCRQIKHGFERRLLEVMR